MALIRNRQIETDAWQHLEDDETRTGDATVSLSRLEQEHEALFSAGPRIGVRVPGECDPEALAPFLKQLDLIAISFPKFTDGRGYSLARLLRQRFDYKGELRATGDVLHDQLLPLLRCGFDSFELKEGKDAQAALEAFETFSVKYQGVVDEPQPLWRRVSRPSGPAARSRAKDAP